MSISQNIRNSKYRRRIKKFFEMIQRESVSEQLKVYFPYKVDLIHPAFNELKNNPPIRYVNKYRAELLHLVMGGSKKDLEKPHIVEIIDHAFSIVASYEVFPREPVEYYNRQEIIRELYLDENLKKLVFISNGQRELFKYYFPEKEILDKSVVIPLPWKDNIAIGKKDKSKNINFLFIASNYHTKGVEIVLKAWKIFAKNNKNATLTLVSHDIPIDVELKLDKSIELIKQVPLNLNLKNRLYKHADVVLTITLTDGVTAIEATSYGKPIITFRTQHSKDFIDNDNGIEIDVPVNVYDVKSYEIVWKTKQEFDEIVKEYIKNGKFDKTIDDLVSAFKRYK